MKNNTGTGALPAEHPETLDDIDAAVEAIPADEITRRLHDVLAQALRERIPELDAAGPSELPLILAGADIEELLEVQSRLRTTRQRLRAIEAELEKARMRRDEMLRQASVLQRTLAHSRWNLAKADPGDDSYITEILQLGQKILDQARADAHDVRKTADDYAKNLMDRTVWRAETLALRIPDRK